MDIDQLITFMEVAKLGSFSRAGEKVYRSQSAVSAQIRQLEEEYGDRLFDRSGKTVTLTGAGRVLFDYAERIIQLKDESRLAVADAGTTVRGSLTVGANEATCMYVLPNVFATYCSKYPNVQVTIYRNFSYKIIEKLESGVLDAGIVTLPVKSPNLKAHTIFRDRLMLMVSAENPLAGRKSVTAEDVAGQPLILPTRGYTRRLMEKLLHPYAPQLQIRMELASVGVIKSFVAANIGVTLLSESFARDEVQAGRVKLIPLRDAELWRELGLVYRTNRLQTRAVSSFISTVREVANDLRSPAASAAR